MHFNKINISINMEIREDKKMKKLFLIFGLLSVFILSGLAVHAKTNYLHSITLEKNNGGYNIILKSDDFTKVIRRVTSENELVLELTGIKSSDTVNALYKGTNDVDNLIIENNSPNKLKIYITAPNIANSSVFIEPEGGKSALTGEDFPYKKAIWAVFALIIFAGICKRSVKRSIADNNILIKKDIKDREIEMYRRYRKNFEEENSKVNNAARMRTVLKNIDRKIDERLMTSIK